MKELIDLNHYPYEMRVNDALLFLAMRLSFPAKDDSVSHEEVIEKWKKKTEKA